MLWQNRWVSIAYGGLSLSAENDPTDVNYGTGGKGAAIWILPGLPMEGTPEDPDVPLLRPCHVDRFDIFADRLELFCTPPDGGKKVVFALTAEAHGFTLTQLK